MEIECDLASIRDEDLLRKMWQQSEDFGRKKEIRSHLYKLRESRLREFYSLGGPGGGGDIMNPATDLCFGKTPLTPSHGDSLEDHSFQSLKSKEVRDSESPSREIKFRNSGGVAGGVLVPDTTGWNVQTSTEVSPDGRAFRSETLAKTDGVEQIAGGRAEFAGRNEQKSSASHQGDDKNYVKKAAESSKTHLQENIVIGDEKSGRTEMKSSSVTSSSSKVVSSSSTKVLSSGDPGFDLEPVSLPQDQRYQKIANSSALRSEQQKYQTSSNVRDTYDENKKYVDMDKASPEYQQHVQYLMSQPGTVVSNTVEYPKPGVKMITTVKQLPDGTTVKTKRYETEASADAGSISQTMKQQQRVSSSTSSQKTSSEKRIQDSEDVFSRLTRPRDTSVPSGSRTVPESPSPEDIYSRLQKSRGGSVNEKKFSETIDQRSTQILRDTNQQPSSAVPRNAPISKVHDLVDNVEVFSNKTVKKDLSQAIRNEKITSSDFIATERDRYVLDRGSPVSRGPDGLPTALAPITPGGYRQPQSDDIVPTNGYTSTGVIQQSSKSSSKFSESRRFSTETVESYQHSESHNENQDFTTQGFPSVRRPIDEPKGRSPSAGRPSQGFSTHGFPSVRSDKPTQEYPSDRPRPGEEYTTPSRTHPVKGDRPVPSEENISSTTRANYSTNETRRHVTSTTNDFSTHGFPSVRPDTPTRDSTKRPTSFEPAGASPRRPSGQDQPQSHNRKPSTDGYSSTHGFPSVKTPTSSDYDAPRRPSGTEPSGASPRGPSGQDQPQSHGRKPSTDGFSSTHGFPSVKTPTPTDQDSPRRPSGAEPANQGRRPTPDDFSTHGFPSVKPGRTTPTQSSPQYDDTSRGTPIRRLPSVDHEDTVSVTSDRSNSVIYEKRIDAAHQAFARSLRCASPVDSIRRDSFSDRQTPRSSVTIVRHTYSPSKRDGRSPSHDSITNSESSRISSGTVTKTHRIPATDNRRPSGPKSPLTRGAPSHVSNETIDLTLTRKITARPADKPTPKQPAVKDQSQLAEPLLRKEIFPANEGFLASEGVAEEPILKKDSYYQLGPSDATLPSSHQKRQLIGTTPNTSRRPNTHNTEEEVITLLDTAPKHTTPKKTPTSPDTKPTKPETLYSNKPKTRPEGYVSLNRATEITEKHNQTTNKQVSSPHYIPTAPKADRSPSDRPTKNLPSSAPTTITTTTTTSTIPHHSAPKSVTDKPKPSSSPSKPDNSTTRLTKTVKVDSATTTRDTTKTRREPERKPGPQAEPLSEPEDTDEGYVPDRKGVSKPRSKRPTSDDEGFEPDSPRAGSPTSDFEFHRSRPTEPVDEEDAIFKITRRTDKKTVTNEFLDTERGVKQPRQPKDGDREPIDGARRPRYPGDDQPGTRRPKQPEDLTCEPSRLVNEPSKPSNRDVKEPKRPKDLPNEKSRKPVQLNGKPDEPKQGSRSTSSKPRHPDEEKNKPVSRRPNEKVSQPQEPTDRTNNVTVRKTTTITSEVDERSPLSGPQDYPRGRSPTEKDYPRGKSPTEKTYGRSPTDDVTVRKTTTISSEVDERSPLSRPQDSPRGKFPTEKDYTRGRSPTEKPRGRSPTDDVTVKRTTQVTEDTTFTSEVDQRSPLSRPKDSPRGRSPTEKDYPRGRSPTEKPYGRSPTDDVTVRKTTTITSEVDERSPLSGPKDSPRGRSPTEKDYPRGRSPTQKPRERSPTDDVTVKRTTQLTEDTTFTSEVDERSPLSRPKDSPRGRSPTEKDYPRGRSPTEKPYGRSPTDDVTVRKTTTITSEVDERSPLSGPKDSPRGRSPTEKDYPRGRSPTEKPYGRSPTDDVTVRKTTTITSEVDERSPLSGPKDSPRGRSPTEKDYPRGRSPTEKPRGRSPTDDVTVKRTTQVTEDTTFTSEVDQRSPLSRPKDSPRGRSPTEKDYPRGRSPTEKPYGRSPTDDVTVRKTTTITSEVDERSPFSGPKDSPRGRSPIEKDYPRGRSPTEKPRGRSPTDDVTVKRTTQVTEDTTFTSEVDERSPLSRPKDSPRGRSPTEKDYPRGRSPTEKPYGRSPTDDVTVRKTTTITSEVDERSPLSGPKDSPHGRSPTEKDYPRGRSPTEKPRGRSPTDDVTVKRTTQVTKDTTFISEVDQRSPLSRPKDYPRGGSPIEKDSPRGVYPTEKLTGPDSKKPRSGKPTLDRSETFEERCRHILGMENETTTERSKRLQEFIDIERDTVYVQRKPDDRFPSPQKKVPFDTVSIEDCDDDDAGVPQKRPTSKTTTTVRTTKTTNGEYPRDDHTPKSPTGAKPTKPNRETSPTGRTITTQTTTRKTTGVTDTVDDRYPTSRSKDYTRSDVSDEVFEPSRERPEPREPSEHSPNDNITVTRTTNTTTEVDERSPLSRPKDSPRGRSPTEKDYPRGKSPTEKPRGRSPIDDVTVKRTTQVTEDTTFTSEADQRSPLSRPKDSPQGRSPTEKDYPRGRSPTEKPCRRSPTDDVTVKRTTQVTEDTTFTSEVDQRSPLSRPKDYPRGRSPTEKDYPRGKSPTEKTYGRSPTDDVTVRKTTTITSEADERSPLSGPKDSPRGRSPTDKDYPRGRSPTEKPRGRSPTDDVTVKRTTQVTEDTTFTSEVDQRSPLSRPKDSPRGTSPTEKDYPRGRSPTEKPYGRSPTDDVTVRKTTTITSEVDERSPFSGPKDSPRGRPPTEKDYPRGRSPTEKPCGRSPTDDVTVRKTTTITSEVDERSPLSRPKDYPRGRSPTEKGSPRGKSPTVKDYPRGKSPTEKPRGRSPTDDVTVRKTTTIISEVDERSPISRPKEPKQPDRSPSALSKPKDRSSPRSGSPVDKPLKEKPNRFESSDNEFEETVVESTTKTSRERTISEQITDRTSKVRPRDVSPSDDSPTDKTRGPKPTKDIQRPRETSPSQKKPQPRDRSPTEKPKGSRPTSDTNVQRMVKTITERTVVDERSPKDRPRGTSPSEKPKRHQPGDKFEEVVTERTTKRTHDTVLVDKEYPTIPFSSDVSDDEETVEKSPSSPRDRSPSGKPKGTHPTDDITVKRVVKTTITEERSPKGPRGSSPSEKPGPKGYPRDKSPTEKGVGPKQTSPSEKPGPKTYPRDKSPTEKPVGPKPTSGTSVQRIIKTITDRTTPKERPLGTTPLEKPKRRPQTEEQTTVKRTTKTIKGTTVLKEANVDTRSPKGRPSQRSPLGKPKGVQPSDDESDEEITVIETWYSTDGITPQKTPSNVPTDEDVEETVVQRTSRITKDRATVEKVDIHGRRPQGKSPSSPRNRSPSEKPKGTKPTDSRPRREPTDEEISMTVVQKTAKTTRDMTTLEEINDRLPKRETSPSDKPRKVRPSDEEPFPSDEETDETYIRKTTRDTTTLDDTEDRPRGRSPSSRLRPRGSSPSPVDETTVRSTTTKTIRQETDFEKRYPNGRPREPSPVGKSTPRRPSKPTTTTSTTTTTRNRSTLDEQDITKSPRPKTQPSTRDKLPTKSTPSYVPHSQPTVEKRVPAELPSPGRKPKSTFGTTTRTTTQTTVTKLPATRPVPNKETPKKTSTGPRPTARQPERKQPESISPDSSPSRPTSEVELDSPNRSPNTSPFRHTPSPTRSVKLEDITSSVVTTKKTTVVVDKSKPKVTHITTAKFQVSPPSSPTKVMPAPEIKSSPARKPTPKPTATKLTTNKTTKVTTTRKDIVHPTDSERDSEVPTDAEDIDSPLTQKSPSKKMPVIQRKESAPVHRVTKVDKDVQKMSRSTSENIIKTTTAKRPPKHEPLEPIASGKMSPKTERRPNKHLSTKTINLTTFDKVINSEDMENVVIDIQQAKSSREPSPNKIVPTPVAVDLYTGKPRYPDVVQEPEDEPRKKPNVKNIPIFEEETNDFVGCQITEVNEDYLENTTKARTRKFIDGETRPQRPNPTIVTSDNVDNECLLSVHDKVSKFINTAEEVSKPKTSAPFRRDLPEEDVPEDDECLLTVDEKVNKFLKTAESVTKDVMTSTPKPIERPRIDDLDEELRTDECVLSVSEKVNRFTTKAEKLAPSAPQRSPELVARIERQISKQSDVEPESPRDTRIYPDSPEDDDSPTGVRKVKQTKSVFEQDVRKYTDRQIDILSRPSVWDKKPKSDIKLDDILGEGPDDAEPRTDGYVPRKNAPVTEQPDAVISKPVRPIPDTVSKKKEIFENKISTQRTTATSRPGTKSPERAPRAPTESPRGRRPSDESDSRYPSEFTPRYVDAYPQEPDDSTEEVYGTSKAHRVHETSSLRTTTVRHSPERPSPTRKSSHPENRPSTQTPTRTSKKPEDHSPSRRYSDDPSPRHRPRDQPQTDLYTETRETSEYTTRSSTQTPDRRTRPENTSPSSPRRKQPVEEPEDYTFSSLREETNQHHTSRTSYRSPKDRPLNQTSIPDDDDQDHSPARSTSTVSSQKRVTSLRSTSNRLTEDSTSRRPRRPSGNEPSTPTSTGRGPRPRGVPETVAARRNIFEKSPGDVSPRPGQRRPSYMEPTKSSIEHHRRDSLEVTKTTYSRKSSMEDEPYEPSPRGTVKFGGLKPTKDELKPKRKLSSSEIPNIEDVFDLELLEEMLNIVTSYEQRRRVRAQIRIVKKLLETKTKEEVSKMTKITTIRKTSSTSQRDSPIPRRDTPIRPERYHAPDDIDSESVIESHHIEEHEEIIRERSISPQTKSTKTITKVTEVRKVGEPSSMKRPVPKKEEPKDSKPIWATKNILKKPSENEKVARALSAKKTTSTTSTSRTQQTHRQRVAADEDCITSSYGIGPTDEDGRPLFGIRALKKKTTTSKTAQPSETTKVTGTVITEKFYSENGAEPVGERKVTVYSSNPEELEALESQYDRRDSETVKRERLSKDGLTSVTKVQKIGSYKPGDVPAITDDAEFTTSSSKTVRRGSVKEMSEKFIRKESSSSVTEKSNNYPKAGLILRTRTNSGATADTADQYEVRGRSVEYDDESGDDCDVEIRTSRKHSKVVTESEDEMEIRRKVNTRSFLNSAGSKVTGVDDVLDRMRNADNVVVDGDTLEDREARSLLNKFLGASVLMSGMESIIPQKELKKATGGSDNLKKQEVKTTRVTKTIKSAATGGNSSSPVARETCDFEEIWDEEILKELLEKSTSYEERRSIRARLRQLMAEREACAEIVASVKAELNNDKNVKTTSADKKQVESKQQQQQQEADDDSSCSEYEEIIEEYTASEDDDEEAQPQTTIVAVAAKKKEEVKEEAKPKKIIEEIKKTTITKNAEPTKSNQTKTVVVEKTTVIKKDATIASKADQDDNNSKNKNGDDASVSDSSKGESLLIPLLQGLLHKNMPQARASSSVNSSKTATNPTATTAIANQNSNNLKSSLKSNNTRFSSTSSNCNNSLGDSGLSSEVSRNSSLGQQGGSSLRVTSQQIEDSGTESGEDLRLIAAGIRDSMQIEGIENQSDMSLIKEVTNALNRLESSLKEGKDLALDSSKKNTLLALVERLQTGLTAPDKLSLADAEEDVPDETSSPEADIHRSNRQRFAKRRNRNNRHTVGVSKEELADARRYMEEKVMIENLSNCTTPECNAATTPPQFFAIQKQASSGAILSSSNQQEATSSLFRPNQFVPSNLKQSTDVGSGSHPDVQLRPKKTNPALNQRQSAGDMEYMTVGDNQISSAKRPLSDSYDSYSTQGNRVSFSDTKEQRETFVQEKNQYNRSYHSENQPDVTNRSSPDSSRGNRFNNKKQLMKRANTIDIPKSHRYNPEFDTDSEFEEKSSFNVKGLRGTVQVSVKRKPRQVVPTFEPKTENDHKFLAFIQKQNPSPGLGWNTSKSVSNWTNKFGNIKNVFETGAPPQSSNGPKAPTQPASSAKSFWKKNDEQNPPPKVSSSVLTSALKAKERNEKMAEVVVPKPIHINQFSHNPQSAFRPVEVAPEPIQSQFKPIPMEKPINVVNSLSPTKPYNPVSFRKPPSESPNYSQPSPTKSWIKKNTATNSPVTLPWTVKPPESNVLKMAATKFESKSPLSAVQRHHSFKQQEKRPSLPNATHPYQYQYDGYSMPNYMSNSQPASYAEYAPPPRIVRENSLTNPQAEPLVLTPDKPAYSPHSLQPYDYYTDGLGSNVHQTDMTDDDIDDMESMTEYRVEAKVMGKPVSQQAVTVGKRTAHVSDDEVFGKNSRAAKNLLSVMKNIGNGNGNEKASKKVERNIAPSACISPDGRPYQAPVVEPLFPDVTKFETNRLPDYIGPQPHQRQQQQQVVEYQKNPVYVPLTDYQQQQPPVAPPRNRKINQEAKSAPAYYPQERPNVYQPPRRDAPSSLTIQSGPLSPPSYSYNSPSKTPDSTPYTTQIITDGMYMQNIPTFRQQSGPNTPDDYIAHQSPQAPNPRQIQPQSYQAPPPIVNLPQIPLETSYTKVYDKPRDIPPYKPTVYPASPAYQNAPHVQPQMSPRVPQSPQQPSFVPQQAYQPRTEVPPQYYQSPPVYQQNADVPQQYYQSPKVQQSPQSPPFSPQQVPYYQSPKVQPNSQAPVFSPQQTEPPYQYNQPPQKVQHAPQPMSPPYQPAASPQMKQQAPQPMSAPYQSAAPPQMKQQAPQPMSAPYQPAAPPQMKQQAPQPMSPVYQPKAPAQMKQQAPQPMSPVYQPKAPPQMKQQGPLSPPYQPTPPAVQQTPKQAPQPKPQVQPKAETVMQSSNSQYTAATYRQQKQQQTTVARAGPPSPVKPVPNSAALCKQASLDGRSRVQAQSQFYEKVEEVRRKSLGNVLEITRLEREARDQKAAAIKQDMYSVQQDVYSQQVKMEQKIEARQQEVKVYKSSAPDDTPDIVKSSLAKEDIPILKKFGPPQRHCYIPNAYQNPLTKSETTVMGNQSKPAPRKMSEPSVNRGPVIVETPSTPQPDGQDEIPRNIVFNNVNAFTSMSRRYGETTTEYTSNQSRPNKLSKCDSWNQICQIQNAAKPAEPKFSHSGNALRRTKSGHTLALPKLYEAGYDRVEMTEKQKTVAAYFTGQKSPNSLSRNSSQTHLHDTDTTATTVSVKKSSINRIKTSEKASISKQNPSSGLSRSHTMPHIANVNMLDETNVEDAFEQLMNGLSTTTTEKTETKQEDGAVVTTTTKVTTRTVTGAPKPVSPFAKFQQLDKQSSLQSPKSPITPTTPGGSSTGSTPIFRFTDPALNARAATVKEQLLQWCQYKTQEYENVQITNFSTSWTDGLAFCALIHHFLPDAFDYSKLTPKQRRYNFELAFRVADEKAGIAPLLDVEDMVVMKRPDWKCVFTYVQSIYRRFRNCQ